MTGAGASSMCRLMVIGMAGWPVAVAVKPMSTALVSIVVGVPEMTPVAVFSESPSGSGEADQVPAGSPWARNVVEYGRVRFPLGSVLVVMTGLGASLTVIVMVLVGATSPVLVFLKLISVAVFWT